METIPNPSQAPKGLFEESPHPLQHFMFVPTQGMQTNNKAAEP